MDKLRQEVVQKIAKNGVAYTNEVKAMATELLELRQKLNAPPIDDNYLWIPDPWKANTP